MSRSEVTLKILIGSVLGAELVGGSTLLALGVYAGLEAIQSLAFSAAWLIVSAVIGAAVAVHYLPPFSRDRGRISDFLVHSNQLGGYLGFQETLCRSETDSSPSRHPVWTTSRFGRQANH